jgi:hypothetical protein
VSRVPKSDKVTLIAGTVFKSLFGHCFHCFEIVVLWCWCGVVWCWCGVVSRVPKSDKVTLIAGRGFESLLLHFNYAVVVSDSWNLNAHLLIFFVIVRFNPISAASFYPQSLYNAQKLYKTLYYAP